MGGWIKKEGGVKKTKMDEILKKGLGYRERECVRKMKKKKERQVWGDERGRVKGRSPVGNDLKRIVGPTCPLHEQKC